MTTAVQNRRGTTAEHATFTGLEGEVTIDTTKDTAVIHDGTLAGGYPLAKETLSNVNPSTLSALTGSATASDDLFLVFDSSTLTMKKITRAELNNAIEADALASVTITGGTINGTTIGATTAAAGSFTTLTASGATIVPAPTLSTHAATKGYVDTALTDLVDSAPAALDTLNELAAALGDDANFSTTVTNSIALKAPLANPTFTGTATIPTADINGGTIDGTAIGASTASTGAFTTLAASGAVTLSGGTANGVAYLNGSKVLTSGSALTFDGTNGGTSGIWIAGNLKATAGGYLRVNRADNNTFNEIKYVSAGDLFYFNQDNGGAYQFNISGSEQMRLTSTGLGIGTSSPTEKLRVVGTSGSPQFGAGTASNGVFINAFDSNPVYMTVSAVNSTAFGLGSASNIPTFFMTNNTERMRITSAGNVGIGTSSPSAKLDIKGLARSSIGTGTGAGGAGYAFYQFGASATATENWHIGAEGDGSFRFYNQGFGAGLERMRIDSSGNLLVGTTTSAAKCTFENPTAGGISVAANFNGTNSVGYWGRYGSASGTAYFGWWHYNGSAVGSITSTGSSTSYNTTSDYRLKEDWVAVADASTRVNALKPVNFAWKADGSRVDGFLAHELAEVVPEAVTGTKDAVDAEGNPEYQGIDQSKLVPLLTAALQEALVKIESLTARVSALEGN